MVVVLTGVIYVYEIKPATDYGLTGIDQLARYVSQLEKMHPGSIVNAGRGLDSADFVSREGHGRVWSGKRRRDDEKSSDGMRWYGMSNPPKTLTRVTNDTQQEAKTEEKEPWWTKIPPAPDVSQKANDIVGLFALGAFCVATPVCAMEG